MIKWRSEALVQGLDPTALTWYCSLSCYTDAFKQLGDTVKDTYSAPTSCRSRRPT